MIVVFNCFNRSSTRPNNEYFWEKGFANNDVGFNAFYGFNKYIPEEEILYETD